LKDSSQKKTLRWPINEEKCPASLAIKKVHVKGILRVCVTRSEQPSGRKPRQNAGEDVGWMLTLLAGM
jgi:hypothetical protein